VLTAPPLVLPKTFNAFDTHARSGSTPPDPDLF
jgi:hypothetical protein